MRYHGPAITGGASFDGPSPVEHQNCNQMAISSFLHDGRKKFLEFYQIGRPKRFMPSRRCKGAKDAGLHVIGITVDFTVLIGDKPLDATSLALPPLVEHDTPPSWRRFTPRRPSKSGWPVKRCS